VPSPWEVPACASGTVSAVSTAEMTRNRLMCS